ncbi:type IV pilin N-terminal domain-containing protein [Halalkalicoccus tibetensis]|uniref:Type IV pilin N-terminal domain-containing protein n=1 Tax=Halalkalicoccus tibetensis TaxID=175632 RepID=A0ABD5V8W8_9EURY
MARAISPVIGVVLLIACTIGLSAVVGVMAFAYEPAQPASIVVVGGEADAAADRITLTLERGGPLDMRELSLAVAIDGDPLETQPSYGSQRGLSGYPNGALNPGTDSEWNQGESTSFVIAGTTNGPHPEPGSAVTVRLHEDGLPIATVETTAR